MASQAQIEANRRNAKKSTGPTTEAGKSASKFNALKHGMTAATSVLPHEDPISFDELLQSLITDYNPATGIERTLVETIADAYWRLLRARRSETEFFEITMRSLKRKYDKPTGPQVDDDGAMTVVMCNQDDDLAKLQRYATTIEKTYFRAIETLRKLQKDRLREERLTTAQPRQIGFVSRAQAQTAFAANSEPLAQHDKERERAEDSHQQQAGRNCNRQPSHLHDEHSGEWLRSGTATEFTLVLQRSGMKEDLICAR